VSFEEQIMSKKNIRTYFQSQLEGIVFIIQLLWSIIKFIGERGRVTVLRAHADQSGKQVCYCTNNCTILLYICTVIWTVFAAVG